MLNFKNQDADSYAIHLFSIDGKWISQVAKEIFIPVGLYSKNIELPNLANGVYLLSMCSNRKNISQKIIISQ